MPSTVTYHIGDAVIVNAGVMCPDKPTLSLAGWQGRVREIYPEEGTILIQWDSMTLRAIPDDYIRESLIEGLGWESMGLEANEIAPASPRDTPQEAEATYEKIMAHHHWDHLADLNPGISEVLGPLGNTDIDTCLQAWEQYLGRVLRFPFEARLEEQLRRGPVAVGKIVQVLGIADVVDRFGLYVHVRLDRRSHTLPLCELEATDYTSSNYQPLNDYVVWFANR